MKHIVLLAGMLMITICCDDIIGVDDISQDSVILLSPSDSSLFNLSEPGDTVMYDAIELTFTWEPLADSVRYDIQIATPSFKNARQFVQDTQTQANSHVVVLGADSYEWRVRAINSDYETRYTTQSFMVLE